MKRIVCSIVGISAALMVSAQAQAEPMRQQPMMNNAAVHTQFRPAAPVRSRPISRPIQGIRTRPSQGVVARPVQGIPARPAQGIAAGDHDRGRGRDPDHDGDIDRRHHHDRTFVIYETYPYFYNYPNEDVYYPPEPLNYSSTLTVDDIVRMVDQGSSDDDIIAAIQSSRTAFTLSVDTIRYLQAHSVSERLINYMLSTGQPAAGY